MRRDLAEVITSFKGNTRGGGPMMNFGQIYRRRVP
jgi:hypothetical protein